MTKEEVLVKYNIDITRLKRNYIIQPICKHKTPADIPFKEDIYYLYVECLVDYTELYKYFFQVSHGLFDQWLQKFNIKRPTSYKNNHREQTNLLHFGVKSNMQSPEVKQKHQKTVFRKYGVYNVSQLEDIKLKKIKTEHKNNSFGKSKSEEEIYKLLLTKFNNIKRQHYDKIKYPWKCDFYIPELDLYIEYQGHWSHGEGIYHEPYNYMNINHNQLLDIWKKKAVTSSRYKDAIKTWTIRDPLKRKTAKENNLNWLEFFNMNEFLEWFNKQ